MMAHKRLTEFLPAHVVADRLQDAINQVRFCIDASSHPVATHYLCDVLFGMEHAHRLLLMRAQAEADKIGQAP